jgi:hypothetical protein
MPDFKEEDFQLIPTFEVIHDWSLIFHSAGRREVIGPKGLTDIVELGRLYGDASFAEREEIDKEERETLTHLRVVLSI